MKSRRLIVAPRGPDTNGSNPCRCSEGPVWGPIDVRFGSYADICAAKTDVRFTPESGHVRCTRPCLLGARSGHTVFNEGALTAMPQQRASLPHDTIPLGSTQVTPDHINWSWRDRAVVLGIETFGKGPVLLLLPALSSISTRA